LRILHYTLITVCSFLTALFIAWKLLQPVNYGYSLFYQWLDISSHIQTFAPQNRQGKNGFEQTSEEDHHQLFAGISQSINNSGEGLRELSYQADGESRVLLTDAEATHLEDVAALVDLMMPAGWAVLGLWIALLFVARWLAIPLPSLGGSLLTLAVVAMVLLATIFIIGPHVIFRAFHELVFPPENQWFFYYQDSLMTTLMKAPDIFFAIAVLWAIVAMACYLIQAAVMKVLNPPTRQPTGNAKSPGQARRE
jgi:hypothetical protein